MEDKKKYVPTLVVISVQELIKSIRAKASSTDVGPTCDFAYAEENACGAWADGEDGIGAGGGSGGNTGNLCVDIGPLLGCDEDSLLACNLVALLR